MKKNKLSIKWQLFGYLTGFVAVLLIGLWLFQVVFLNDFYETIKVSEIKQVGNRIVKTINGRSFENIFINPQTMELVDQIAKSKDVSIIITDESGFELHRTGTAQEDGFYLLKHEEYRRFMQKAKENDGIVTERRPYNATYSAITEERKYGQRSLKIHSQVKALQSVIYGQLATGSEGEYYFVIINGLISPIDATVQTIRKQLVYVTFMMLIMAFGLAIWVSKKIAGPIVKINEAAKELPKGIEGASFDGKGYKEIAELSETLNYAAHELSRTENLRKELIANVSHDLRTPLTLITGYAEVMRDLPGENTPENTQIIIDEAKRLSQLVNDMLDLSKLQAGTSNLTLTNFNLTQSIREIMKRYQTLTGPGGYQIEFEAEEEVWVKADELRLSQVVYNLINNAINYTGEDKKVVVKQIVKGGFVRVEVIDTGEGISEENLPYIWDRYYKVDKTHKRAAIGTGLGLSIVRSILDMHHGKYGVMSKSGEGSNFWFELVKMS